MKLILPKAVEEILNKLISKGFEAYIVGGCIRDLLLGRNPKDWDITTNASPESVKALFPKTVDIGLRHGTVAVAGGSTYYEVTSFKSRTEKKEALQDDLKVRDFTMNAIAYHPQIGLMDPFLGQKDISNKIIRGVEDPASRFREDPLRMLRAVRFMAQLGFRIDEKTYLAMIQEANKIQRVSPERIREELTKILLADAWALQVLHDCGLLGYILPEFEACFGIAQHHPYHLYDVAEHTIRAVCYVEKSPILVWTMLLHDLGKPVTKFRGDDGWDHFYGHEEKSILLGEQILKRLKFDNQSTEAILTLVRYHDVPLEENKSALRKLISKISPERIDLLLKVKQADSQAQNPALSQKKIDRLPVIRGLLEEILKDKDCIRLESLAITGGDLIHHFNLEPSPLVGQTLQYLLGLVMEFPEQNTSEFLLKAASEFLYVHNISPKISPEALD